MGSQEAAPAGAGGLSPQEEKKTLHRAIAGSAIGNAIEWYDYGLYGFLSAQIGIHFLPESMPAFLRQMLVFTIFAVPFVVRPLGAGIFGAIGDRVGRQKILAFTVILIAGGTFIIGCIPSFSTISVVAPIILVLMRVVQGLAAGGEYGGAATFMAEYSPDKKRGFYGSFLEFGTLTGFLAGTGVSLLVLTIVGQADFDSWGWRIPFLLSGPIGLFGLYMRSKLEDTPVFKELAAEGAQEQQTAAQFKDLAKHWKPIVICFGMVLMLNVHNYTLFTYMVSYLGNPKGAGLSENWALGLTAIMYAVMMALMALGGSASDRWGRRPSWFFSGTALFVLALPAFYLMLNAPIPVKILALVGLGIVYVPQLSTISATFPAMFPTHIRYFAFALTYNVATALAGGPTPAINTWGTEKIGNYFPAFYLMAASVVGLIAVYFAKETAGASVRGTDVPDIEKQKAAAGAE
ncbi:MAG: MFS transporter [Streptosporangiales bacterium]|nr:MFS transporter [Streptosporangiales bacterium]